MPNRTFANRLAREPSVPAPGNRAMTSGQDGRAGRAAAVEASAPGVRFDFGEIAILPNGQGGAPSQQASSSSEGSPLDPMQRSVFEAQLGVDLGRVRVHADAPAARAANELDARAFTLGQHLFFGAGEYHPHHDEGRRLLAHEVAHAVQQRLEPSLPPRTQTIARLPRDHAAERAADAAATAMVSGFVAPRLPATPLSIACQKKGKDKVAAKPLIAQVIIDLAAKRVKFVTSTEEEYFGKVDTDLEAGAYKLKADLPKQLWGIVGSKPGLRFSVNLDDADPWSSFRYPAELPLTVTSGGVTTPDAALPPVGETTPKLTPQQEYEATLAYYSSMRDARLEKKVEAVKADLPKLSPTDIEARWKSDKSSLVAAAQQPNHGIKAEQLFQIWSRYWGERTDLAEKTREAILKSESDKDFDAYIRKMGDYENGNRNALGEGFAKADETMQLGQLMMRYATYAHEIARFADAEGKSLTLDQLTERTRSFAAVREPFVKSVEMAVIFRPTSTVRPPVKNQPVKNEPVKTEPVKNEPVKNQPVKTEPVKTEPVKTEPVKPAPVKPTQANPASLPEPVVQHAEVGDFPKPGNPKKNPNPSTMSGGGHGQANIEYLDKIGMEYKVEHTYSNGVRLGNIPKHRNAMKRTGTGQSWFPKSWTKADIKAAGEHVVNNTPNFDSVADGQPVYGNYKGVRVGVIKTGGKPATVFPDGAQQPSAANPGTTEVPPPPPNPPP